MPSSWLCGGMTVEAIKDAIQRLPEEQRTSLLAWLNEMEYDAWDKQMASDLSPGGRGADWAAQLKQEALEAGPESIAEGFRRRKHRP